MSQAVAAPQEHNVNLLRATRSEYIKVISLRSTWTLLLITAAVLIGLAALFALGAAQSAGTEAAIPPSMIHTLATSGAVFGHLVMASFGAVFIGGEYGTGMIRSTMTAVPNRWSAIVAKAIVLAVIAFVVGIVSGFISYFVAQPILNTQDLGFSLGTHGVVGSIFGFALYLLLITLLGMSLALLLRNSALGIVIVLALLLMVPIIFQLIPLDFLSDMRPFLPSEAGGQMFEIDTSGDKLNQWQGGLVCAAWAAVLFAASLTSTKMRDV